LLLIIIVIPRSSAAVGCAIATFDLIGTVSQGEIIKEFDDQLFLKGTINDTIIGSVRAYVKNGSCFIGRLIVHPNYQNKGIGTKLMCEIEKRFDNTNRFELFTGYKSEQNIRFYENLGYNIIRTEQISDNFKFVY